MQSYVVDEKKIPFNYNGHSANFCHWLAFAFVINISKLFATQTNYAVVGCTHRMSLFKSVCIGFDEPNSGIT